MLYLLFNLGVDKRVQKPSEQFVRKLPQPSTTTETISLLDDQV